MVSWVRVEKLLARLRSAVEIFVTRPEDEGWVWESVIVSWIVSTERDWTSMVRNGGRTVWLGRRFGESNNPKGADWHEKRTSNEGTIRRAIRLTIVRGVLRSWSCGQNILKGGKG